MVATPACIASVLLATVAHVLASEVVTYPAVGYSPQYFSFDDYEALIIDETQQPTRSFAPPPAQPASPPQAQPKPSSQDPRPSSSTLPKQAAPMPSRRAGTAPLPVLRPPPPRHASSPAGIPSSRVTSRPCFRLRRSWCRRRRGRRCLSIMRFSMRV
ncbi:hypothetical protein EJ05DRAFT_363517 [Pseudovirgaria hyperparasitica]|uniref:Uncharacterized protein n=1 Tax=Pseudovirgaria hyperparasitica TaxID=470096 RepID=A0A6A6W895_9PEZI|nr:uncharacterized protein EJ05DRAFT_363517 [Pseudovirgaria hyperparasitica]KAF2758765.1 hypothetical protein EJ05DRAFT_363517 [Pseudovirgaria hyperparasitica]